MAEDDLTDAYFFQRAFKRAGIPVVLHFVRDGQEVIDYLQGEGQFADRNVHPPAAVGVVGPEYAARRWVRGA